MEVNVPHDELATLQEEIRAEFGRELPLGEISRNKERLERVLAFSKLVSRWEGKLDLIEPASVSTLLKGPTG